MLQYCLQFSFLSEGFILSTGLIVAIVIAVLLIAAIVALVILGRKAQKKQEEQQVQLDAMKQTVTMLIIDKKRTTTE